jgi:sarcosine oxidase
MVGLLEPGGGLLRPERIMHTALQEAKEGTSADVTILDQTQMTNMVQNVGNSGRIELHIQHNDDDAVIVTTDKLLVSMGAWTANLIPSWKRILYPIRQIQGWIDTTSHSPDLYSCRNMPSFVYLSPDWPEALYGVPCDDGTDLFTGTGERTNSSKRGHWLKVGIHKQSLSRTFSFGDHPLQAFPAEIEELAQAIPHAIDERAWGGTKRPPIFVDTKPCLYTMSPDKHFVVGKPADTNNIFAVAGLSGHGFKMTPGALGQMMADFALGKDVAFEWNADFCLPRRFNV